MQKTKIIEIQNDHGLHLRPSASFVKTASEFHSNIFVKHGNDEVNGKSILGLVMLGASKGSKITITAEGIDANNAITVLSNLVENGFVECEKIS